jgi:16S rRNA (guanine527-N7)-methyltransferase
MTSPTQLQELLQTGLDRLGVEVSSMAIQQLFSYQEMLSKWNQHYNLTAVRDPREIITRHLLDSLSILPFVCGEHLLDIGTGAGLPGIPLAIALPNCKILLVEKNGKKARFIRQVLLELRLSQAKVQQVRIETLTHDEGYDCIIARAFSKLARLEALASPILKGGGVILAMKGALATIEHELIELTTGTYQVHALQVPFLAQEQRHLVVIRKP